MGEEPVCGDQFDQYVVTGMKFLDLVAPGWERRIDARTLQMQEQHACICGQVFAKERPMDGYGWACTELFDEGSAFLAGLGIVVPGADEEATDEMMAQFGFNLSHSDFLEWQGSEEGYEGAWDCLKATWMCHINDRLLAQSVGA